MANTPTTLSRSAFSGQLGSSIVLKLVLTTGYTVGGAAAVGPLTGTVTQLMGSNQVRYSITGNLAKSGQLLLPKGTAVS
jgi:hypothetical protein